MIRKLAAFHLNVKSILNVHKTRPASTLSVRIHARRQHVVTSRKSAQFINIARLAHANQDMSAILSKDASFSMTDVTTMAIVHRKLLAYQVNVSILAMQLNRVVSTRFVEFSTLCQSEQWFVRACQDTSATQQFNATNDQHVQMIRSPITLADASAHQDLR